MDVSIILVNFNTKNLTKNCLLSIFEKVKNLDFEVFVVDNNSHDGSCEMIKQEFPQVKLIKNTENKGFASANNIAIRQSIAKYVFLLNTDTILVSNAPKIFFDFMEKPENADVGVCGGKLFDKNLNYIHSYGQLPSLKKLSLSPYISNTLIARVIKKFLFIKDKKEPFENKEVGYITGADMFIRNTVLKETGLFDENFFLYFEETELTHRINKKNYKSVILKDANIIHLFGKSQKNSLKTINRMAKSEILYFEKVLSLKKRLIFP